MNPYEVLGVSETATLADIKKAYRQNAAKSHPDQGGDRDQFQEVQKAYEVLSDSERRKKFDETGDCGEADSSGPSLVFVLLNEKLRMILSNAMLMGEDLDILKELHRSLKSERHGTQKLIKTYEASISVMRRHASRVHKKSDGDNILASIILGPVPAMEVEMQKMKNHCDVVNEALEILKDYECRMEGGKAGVPPKRRSSGPWAPEWALEIPFP